ncbi:MAG: DUF6242 domain-containing protein [Dysgonamonadaceae bacterium]|jgi:hypothetical protein|nr:DUF6242 domain-containing protein [Dysgonamonadaceae bacterium]
MSSKNGLLIISSLLLIVSLLTSCLGDNEYDEIPATEDAEIISFSLSSDSVPTLKSVVFSIDQNQGLIYNHDSMAYQTEIKYKVIVNYTTGEGSSLLNITNIAEGDSTWIKSGDSLDVSKPVLLKSFSIYGTATKVYTLKLNIHQIDPDSVQYIQIASNQDFLQSEEIQTILFKNDFYTFTKTGDGIELYRSSDALDWEKTPLAELPANTIVRGIKSNGEKLFAYTADGDYYESTQADSWTKIALDYPVVSILGYLKLGEGQPLLKEGLSLIIKKDNQDVFAFIDNDNQWTFGEVVPAGFPVSDFASFNSERLKLGYLTVFSGISSNGEVLNTVWSTGNGCYWAKLTNTAYVFPPLRGANVIYYNNEYWILNGRQTDDTYNSEVYSSKDGGTTWSLRPEKCRLPGDYTKRCGATAVVDGKGIYIYILGGKNEGFLPEIWKGYLNKQTFNNNP